MKAYRASLSNLKNAVRLDETLAKYSLPVAVNRDGRGLSLSDGPPRLRNLNKWSVKSTCAAWWSY
jgi:hypothetical protein